MKLTPREQKIYKALYSQEIFTLEDVSQILKNYKQTLKVVKSLLNKQYIQKIKRGLYVIVPYAIAPDKENKYSPDKYLIASKLIKPYFFSHHSALEIHGVANSVFFTVFLSSGKGARTFTYKDITYRFIKTPYFFGLQDKIYSHRKIKVSDKERTFLDCLRSLKYAGGLEEFLKSVIGFPSLDSQKLSLYLKKFNEKSLYQRTGYILTLLKEELKIEKNLLEKLKKQVTNKTYYLDPIMRRKCKKVKEWNLMVPKNIKELIQVA